tara:strand:+ start:603 stop:728 length:126 start_codon:yes stop_codon:yes gene_type:complete
MFKELFTGKEWFFERHLKKGETVNGKLKRGEGLLLRRDKNE